MNDQILASSFGFQADDAAAPRIDLPKGAIVVIGNGRDRTLVRMTLVRRWPRNGSTSDRVQFEDDHGVPRFLTDEQIGTMCRTGEFRVVFGPDGEPVAPRSLIDLTDEEVAQCRRRHAYVEAFLADPHPGSRSRPVVALKIAETRDRIEGKAPCYQSVLDWADLWIERGELLGLPCLHFPTGLGNRKGNISNELVRRAVEVGTYQALATPKGTGETARGFAAAWLQRQLEAEGRHDILAIPELPFALLGDKPAGVELPKELEPWVMPTVRTFQTRMSGENRYLADVARFGEAKARKRRGRSYERPLPELPLSEVECDHTPCDVEVVDEGWQVTFGRPDLIGFRCRCTGSLLGYSISFEAPSYAAFLSGLKHAMYPKDMSEFPGLRAWPMFGRPTRLYVDNAFHFTGKNIRETSAVLGFEIREFKPGEPSLKGAKERLLGVINAKMHRLPGATFSNTSERKLYEDVRGRPTVTLSALRAFLTTYIVQEHHPESHEGLGFMRNLRGIPEVRWRQLIGKVGTPLLPPETDFVALAGDSAWKAVNGQGIRWDHIQYQSDELDAITSAPGHKKGRIREGWSGTEHEGTKYLVRRDPFDLGWVYVANPYDGDRIIKVPAVRSDYARGLTLHQHKVILANTEADLRAAEDPIDALLRARRKVSDFAAQLLEDRKLQGHGKRLARWLEHGRRKHDRSIVGNRTASAAVSSEFLDPTSPVGVAPPAPGSRDAPAATPGRGRGPRPRPHRARPRAAPSTTSSTPPVTTSRSAGTAAPRPWRGASGLGWPPGPPRTTARPNRSRRSGASSTRTRPSGMPARRSPRCPPRQEPRRTARARGRRPSAVPTARATIRPPPPAPSPRLRPAAAGGASTSSATSSPSTRVAPTPARRRRGGAKPRLRSGPRRPVRRGATRPTTSSPSWRRGSAHGPRTPAMHPRVTGQGQVRPGTTITREDEPWRCSMTTT